MWRLDLKTEMLRKPSQPTTCNRRYWKTAVVSQPQPKDRFKDSKAKSSHVPASVCQSSLLVWAQQLRPAAQIQQCLVSGCSSYTLSQALVVSCGCKSTVESAWSYETMAKMYKDCNRVFLIETINTLFWQCYQATCCWSVLSTQWKVSLAKPCLWSRLCESQPSLTLSRWMDTHLTPQSWCRCHQSPEASHFWWLLWLQYTYNHQPAKTHTQTCTETSSSPSSSVQTSSVRMWKYQCTTLTHTLCNISM